MTFGTSIRTCFAKYVIWKGRASRAEYWYFYLFSLLCYAAGFILDAALSTGNNGSKPFFELTALALMLPGISAAVRRLHDTDRSGWFYLIGLIPIVGTVIMIVFCSQAGSPGDNNYGPAPSIGSKFAPQSGRKTASADLDHLERLAQLHEKGILSTAEYEQQKSAILG